MLTTKAYVHVLRLRIYCAGSNFKGYLNSVPVGSAGFSLGLGEGGRGESGDIPPL